MIPGDRLFCAFVENFHVGDTFTDWPLHVTIVPWFRTDTPTDALGRALSQLLGSLEPFVVMVDGEAQLGGRRKIVNLIREPSPLETIEREVRRHLRTLDAWMVDETTKARRAFRPHVTAQKTGRVHEHDTFTVDGLYIVEQKGNYKEVVSRINL